MKLIKSALLGTAAGLAIVSTASAADLGGAKKPTPAEYVRVCSAQGAGFFFVPGSTDTCIKIGGRVRAEYQYRERSTRAQDTFGMRARGVINTDVRTVTDYGLLRTFIAYELNGDTGVYGQGNQAGFTKVLLDKAFIQWGIGGGTLTAGRAGTFFEPANIGMGSFIGLPAGGPDNSNRNLLAYSFAPGNGFVATVSLEDTDSIRRGILFGNGVANPGVVLAPGIGGGAVYGGVQVPDLVGRLEVQQAWGRASIQGAVHQVRTDAFVVNSVAGVPVPGAGARLVDTEYGYAIGAALEINLPILAGARFSINGSYADGAPTYVVGGNLPGGTGGIPAAALTVVDATIIGDSLKLTKAYGVSAGLLLNYTPTIRQNIFGSYSRVDHSNGARNGAFVIGGPLTTAGFDFDFYRVGTNVIWSPVRQLDIAAEVSYSYAELDRNGGVSKRTVRVDRAGLPTGLARSISSDGNWEARLRIQRDF